MLLTKGFGGAQNGAREQWELQGMEVQTPAFNRDIMRSFPWALMGIDAPQFGFNGIPAAV